MARTPAGMARLQELAEVLQAAVVDKAARMNFPTRHPLNQTERAGVVVRSADVILGLELTDFFDNVNEFKDQIDRESTSIYKSNAKLISINGGDLYMKGGGLKGSMQHWLGVYPPGFEIPTFFVAVD